MRRVLRDERPAWDLVVLDLSTMAFRDELRAIAQAAVPVSLFGSSLQNCRFMAPGSAVIEIHGALQNDFGHRDDYHYQRLCAGKLGLNWAGFAPTGFRPDAAEGPDPFRWRVIDGASARDVAHVDPVAFEHVFRLVLAGSWAQLADAYRNATRAHPDPRVRVARRGRGGPV